MEEALEILENVIEETNEKLLELLIKIKPIEYNSQKIAEFPPCKYLINSLNQDWIFQTSNV
jgi:hypothetical protein